MKRLPPPRIWIPAALCGGIFAAAPAAAQTLGQGSDVEISIWRIVAAFVLCALLAVAGAFLLKARQGSVRLVSLIAKQDRRLRLIETLRLGHQADLCIVECDGRQLLIAASAHETRLLANLPFAEKSERSGQGQ